MWLHDFRGVQVHEGAKGEAQVGHEDDHADRNEDRRSQLVLVVDEEPDEDGQLAEAGGDGAELDEELPAQPLHEEGGEDGSQARHEGVDDGDDVAEVLRDDWDQGFLPVDRNGVHSRHLLQEGQVDGEEDGNRRSLEALSDSLGAVGI